MVKYTYANAVVASGSTGSNYSRVTNMQLPYATNQQFNYGSSGTANDRISRVEALKRQRGAGAAATFAGYAYVGLDMAAVVDYPTVSMGLDRTLGPDGKRRTHGFTTGTVGVYPGWDRFGRVVLHSWADDTLTVNNGSLNGGNTGVPNRPPLFQESYTYDKSGNKLTRFDARPGASWPDRDFQFA